MKAKRTVGLLGVSLLLIGSVGVGSTAGSPVTWEFAGEITFVRDDDDRLAGAVTVGSPFSGSFTFESTTIDTTPENPHRGRYDGAVTAISGQVGQIAFLGAAGLNNAVFITNDDTLLGRDGFGMDVMDIATDFLGNTADIFLAFDDSTGTMFLDDSLPVSPPDFDLISISSFTFVTDSERIAIEGTLTSLVPEPATLALVGLGAFLAMSQRRRPRARRLGVFCLLLFGWAGAGEVSAQWTGGPVLIGGDDTDHHFLNLGESYIREGFNFLGREVTNLNTVAVCIGCNIPLNSQARRGFEASFAASDLPPPSGVWTREILTEIPDIEGFFGNAGAVRIQDVGIIYFPGSAQSEGGEVTGGMTQAQLDVVNANRAVLAQFVLHRENGGGGLFTHTLEGLTNPYRWLNSLVPELVAISTPQQTNTPLNLTCAATEGFFNVTTEEEANIRNATPYHTRFEMAPGATSFGGLTVLATGPQPAGPGPPDVVILGAPLPPAIPDSGCDGDPACGDCNGNGIPDECDILSCVDDPGCDDCDGNGVPDSCDIDRCRDEDPFDVACDDCNLNGVPDGCDIDDETSPDDDGDGVPDECVEPTGVGGTNHWSDGTNWDLEGSFPDNFAGVPDLAVTLGPTAAGALAVDLFLNVNVEINALRLRSGGKLAVTQVAAGNLTISTQSGLLDEGTLLVANDRVIDVSSGPVTIGEGGVYKADPDATTPVSALLIAASLTLRGASSPEECVADRLALLALTDEMRVMVSGDFVMAGIPCASLGSHLGAVAGGRTPPTLLVKGSGFLAAAGTISLGNDVEVCVGCETESATGASSGQSGGDPGMGEPARVAAGGDFLNSSVVPSLFDWINGKLILNGTAPQRFEVAGIDLGPTFEGFDTETAPPAGPDTMPHTNFAIGILEVAAGSHVRFVNTQVNTVGVEPCDEALYVRDLILREGSTIVLDRVRVYYVNLIEEPGVTKAFIPCGELVAICASQRPDPPRADFVAANRYLSFAGEDSELEAAIRVRFADLPGVFSVLDGQSLWVSEPIDVSEIAAENNDTAPTFRAATLQCEPYFADWSALGAVHVSHANIVPGGVYEIQTLDSRCWTAEEGFFSDRAAVSMSVWGDVAGPFQTDGEFWTAPDGRVDMTADLLAVVDKFSNLAGAPTKARADLHPQTPDRIIDFLDLVQVVDAFRGFPFPFTRGAEPCLDD